MHYQTSTPGQLVVTWDQVGYYDSKADLLNSFQLVLRSDAFAISPGEGAIGFFYGDMGWEDTDIAQLAATGFGDGAGNGEVLQSSLQPGLNNILQNHHIWFDANLAPVNGNDGVGETPLPGALPLFATGLGALGLLGWRRKRKKAAAV